MRRKVIYVNSRHKQVVKYFDNSEEAIRFCLDVLDPRYRKPRKTCFGWVCEPVREDDHKRIEPEA